MLNPTPSIKEKHSRNGVKEASQKARMSPIVTKLIGLAFIRYTRYLEVVDGSFWSTVAGQSEPVGGALENYCMPALRETSERYKSCSTHISNDILVVCKRFH